MDRPLRVFGHAQAEQAAAEKEVRGRAMGDGRITLMHAGKFGIGKPDAMAEHGAVADETLMIVVVEEILPLREQLGNEGDLFAVFGDVGLHIQFRMFTPQSCRGFELRRRVRSRPARSDGLEQAPSPCHVSISALDWS
jgi:hypothetical protein